MIVGGGFGGLQVARGLRRAAVDITLVDKRNFHLFQPLLYQVATGGLGPAEIAAPLRSLFRKQPNLRVLCAEVVDIDPAQQTVSLHDGHALRWDYLVVAAGASNNYFGNDSWAAHAPGLKTVEDAQEIRRRASETLALPARATLGTRASRPPCKPREKKPTPLRGDTGGEGNTARLPPRFRAELLCPYQAAGERFASSLVSDQSRPARCRCCQSARPCRQLGVRPPSSPALAGS